MAEYPGLPNFGYGAQIPIETLLQLLPFKTLPKQLGQQELARLQAQTGLALEQTAGAAQERGLRPAESAALVGERNATTAGAQGAERRANALFPMQQRMGELQQEGERARTALDKQKHWLNPLETLSQVALRGVEGVQAGERTRIAQQEANQNRDWQKGALENNKLAQLVETLKSAMGASRQVPRLDDKGRVMTDPKTGQLLTQIQSVVTPEMWESLIQHLGGQVPMSGGVTGPGPNADALRALTESVNGQRPSLPPAVQIGKELLNQLNPMSKLDQLQGGLPTSNVQTSLGPQLDVLFKQYPPEQILQTLKAAVDAYYKGKNDELEKLLP